MGDSRSSSSGIGFLGVLTVVFVIAKLWGVIEWSWWWVFAPIWGSMALWGAVFGGMLLFFLITDKAKKRQVKKYIPGKGFL